MLLHLDLVFVCEVKLVYVVLCLVHLENHKLGAGKKLAESIVKEKLAACVNRVPGKCFHYSY